MIWNDSSAFYHRNIEADFESIVEMQYSATYDKSATSPANEFVRRFYMALSTSDYCRGIVNKTLRSVSGNILIIIFALKLLNKT